VAFKVKGFTEMWYSRGKPERRRDNETEEGNGRDGSY